MKITLVPSEELEKLTKGDIEPINVNNTNQIDVLKVTAGLMFQYCLDNRGEGLSACQIGTNRQFFVMRTKEKEYALVINPTYFPAGSRYQTVEGCLSYPDQNFRLKRFRKIKIQFWTIVDDDFIYQEETINGLAAQVFQHETDHCRAITIAQKGKAVK